MSVVFFVYVGSFVCSVAPPPEGGGWGGGGFCGVVGVGALGGCVFLLGVGGGTVCSCGASDACYVAEMQAGRVAVRCAGRVEGGQ